MQQPTRSYLRPLGLSVQAQTGRRSQAYHPEHLSVLGRLGAHLHAENRSRSWEGVSDDDGNDAAAGGSM